MAAIIHIGSDKAGSTALQHALASNREQLRSRGFDYPLLDDGRPDHLGVATKLAAGEAIPDLRGSDDAITVLSSEAFWPLESAAIDRLITAAGGPVTVVAYVRHPAAYVEAAFRQRCSMVTTERQLRAMVQLLKLPARANPIARRAVRRYEQLRNWTRVADQGQLALRPYEIGLPAQVDIVADFCEAAGIPPALMADDSAAEPIRRNVSPTLVELHASVLLREVTDRETQRSFLQNISVAADGGRESSLTPRGLRQFVQHKGTSILAEIDPRFAELAWDQTPQPDGRPPSLDSSAARQYLDDHHS